MTKDIDDALIYAQVNAGKSLRTVAKDAGVPYSTLQRRMKTPLKEKDKKVATKALTEAEEAAICAYIERLDRINMSVRPEFVRDAANTILRERQSSRTPLDEIPVVGPRWVTRFIQRHGFSARRTKTLDLKRQEAENQEVIVSYFFDLQQVIDDNGILPDEIWNMDETGFRSGMGTNAVVITKRKKALYFGLPTNRESATAVEAISAAGNVIPLFLILALPVML
ncbi:hypothetical protein S40288_11568 [Stachybotrys chartarum IBT 40288]|nr:hypothetical protein S40288_11568 [Stachybotrys chartarum IBT 40288]